MSYLTWTAEELKSNCTQLQGECWRIVEAQNRYSTLKIVDTLQEQTRLEELLDGLKPPYPEELKDYNYLLFTPFRYGPYEHGSRFRRQGQKEGVFYGAEKVETAIAEMAFYRFLFFKESPEITIPDNSPEYTAFTVKYETDSAIDLTVDPLAKNHEEWTSKEYYEPCQYVADEARKADMEIIRSFSVRCTKGGRNISIISWKAYRSKSPEKTQTWRMIIKPLEIAAVCEFPKQSITFSRIDFEADPRIKSLEE
jgi:hypothetical protein